MHRIDGEGVAVSMPTPQAVGGTVGYFAAETVNPATQVTGDWLNAVQEEIANAIEDSGITLDKTNHEQLYDAIKSMGGRQWWRSMPFTGRDFDAGSTPMTVTWNVAGYLSLTRNGTTAILFAHTFGVPADIRGIQVLAAKVRYRCTTAFDATLSAKSVKLYRTEPDGTNTEIGAASLTLASTQGSVTTLAFTMAATPILNEGDVLWAQLSLVSLADGTAVGVVRLYSVDVQFEEGHE